MPSRQYETFPSPFPFYRSNVVCVEMHDRRSDPEKRVQIICSPKAILSYTLSALSRYPIRYKVAENRKCYRMGRVQSIYSGRERGGKWAVLHTALQTSDLQPDSLSNHLISTSFTTYTTPFHLFSHRLSHSYHNQAFKPCWRMSEKGQRFGHQR